MRISKSRKLLILVILIVLIYFASPMILGYLGHALIKTDRVNSTADAVIVLSTGVDYPPRLMQAARLYKQGMVEQVIINGDRKTVVMRQLETDGFKAPTPWYENHVALLNFLGVPTENIIAINAQNAYDTITESQLVGQQLARLPIHTLIVTTSKFHTRRAGHIWKQLHGERFKIQTVAANDDPFDPDGWWFDGRQIRHVLAEYGAWLYYWGK